MIKLLILIILIIIFDNISSYMILHKFPVRKCKIVGVICVVLSVIFIFLALSALICYNVQRMNKNLPGEGTAGFGGVFRYRWLIFSFPFLGARYARICTPLIKKQLF